MGKNIVSRQVFPRLVTHLEAPEISVIVGPRQVGKTVLLQQLKTHIVAKMASAQDVYYFNLDIVTDRSIFHHQSDLIDFIRRRTGTNHKTYLLVDEAQRVTNPGLFFKGIYDLELPVKLILTGSSALEIRSQMTEPLTGRKQVFQLFPLSFAEYLEAVEKDLLPYLTQPDMISREKLLRHLDQFQLFGGYPKVVTTDNLEQKSLYLEEIFTSYVEKDVVGFLRIKDAYVFSKFVKVVAQEVGNLFNIEKASQELAIKHQTLKHYLDILEGTFVAERVPPYFHAARAEIRKMSKFYFLDPGIRNFARDGRDFFAKNPKEREDRGSLLENFVFSELKKMELPRVCFWRTKDQAEVDFVLEKKGNLVPVEVKATALTTSAISRSFTSFITRYQPKLGVVVNLALQAEKSVLGTEIHYLLPFELPEFINSL